MLSNSLMNGTCCTMSHRRPSSSSRKKPSGTPQPVASSPGSNEKSKRVTSTSLHTAKVDRTSDQGKSESSFQSRPSNKIEEIELPATQASSASSQDEKSNDATVREKSTAPEPSNLDEKEGDLIGMLTRQLYQAESQMQRMQSVLKKAEDRLRSKDQDIGRLKRKVFGTNVSSPMEDTGPSCLVVRQTVRTREKNQKICRSIAVPFCPTPSSQKSQLELLPDATSNQVKDWEAKSKNQDFIHKKEMQQKKMQIEDSEYLYRRCLGLEHKIFEMEVTIEATDLLRAYVTVNVKNDDLQKFLSDYGLVWVGNSGTKNAKRPDTMPNDLIKNCYAQLTANIEELNMAVGKGEVHVQRNQDGGGASFKTPSCVCLRFYKNGMVIGQGKLRPYSNSNTCSFIRDILDGYFPSELQRSYPNGVPFKVEDHRTETYMGRGSGFPGHGYRLGKQSVIGPRCSSTTEKSIIAATTQSPKCPAGNSDNRKHCCHHFKAGTPSVPSSARSSKTKFYSDPSSFNLLDLRSQILASHNNNCSDTHLQSHINAELGLTSRSERKRTPATKTTEYHMSMREKSLGSGGPRSESARLSSRSRTSQHGSAERQALGSSPSRLACRVSGIRSRPRSASLNSGRYPLRSSSRLSAISGNDGPTKDFNYAKSAGTAKPRVTRSATLDRSDELPIVREINESTSKPGELRLKVRSMNGSIVFLVYVSADDTVARLYQLLDRVLSRGRSRSYKVVMSGYERKRLDQLGVPLREYGISRDSVLHLVND